MKQPDPAASLAKLLTGWWDKMSTQLHVAFPCKVVSFNSETYLASVQPLIRTTEEDPAIIQNVPSVGQRLLSNGSSIPVVYRPALQQGDIVMVICADREIKNAKTGKIVNTDSIRSHNHNDAVIVGVFPWSL